MLKKRKAQGLSIQVIILVAIGLIVLVVIIAIFTGQFGKFTSGLESVASCENFCGSFGMGPSTTILSEQIKECGQDETKISNCCCEEKDTVDEGGSQFDCCRSECAPQCEGLNCDPDC